MRRMLSKSITWWSLSLSMLLVVFAFSFFSFDEESIFRADDPRIIYTGRFEKSVQHTMKTWAPGSYVEFDFYGTEAEIIIEDEMKFGHSHNYIEIVVDGQPIKRMMLTKKNNSISILKTNLPGKHHVLICKDTESEVGWIKILGVKCQTLLEQQRKSKICFEFIGDSITCGNGADSSLISFGTGNWYDYHNAYFSFGPRLAREFQADWILSSVSGIGMNHSCCGIKYTMPEVYQHIDFQKGHSLWDFKSQENPDVIFITLGQNDGYADLSEYSKKYLLFLEQLRSIYPTSWLICCNSPMANKLHKEKLAAQLNYITDAAHQRGDQKVMAFFYKGIYNEGYGQHPTCSQHEEIMIELKDFLLSQLILPSKE